MIFKDKFLIGAWNVGVIECSIEDIFNDLNSFKIRWVKHNYIDRFFADPFLEKQDEMNYFILAEEYLFYERKGKIVRLTVEKKSMKLIDKEIILNDKYHLSYPYVSGEYIIPEGYRSGATYAYKKCEDGCSYEKIKLLNTGLIDQTFLKHNGKSWIFATTAEPKKADALSKLSIFYKDKDSKFIPHKLNPVKNDIKTSRPGGMFFIYRGELYRPTQDSEKRYGHLIRIMKINRLTEDEFKEEEVMALSSEKFPPYNMGFHTFNVYDNCIIVDGYREYHSYLLKPFFNTLLILQKYSNKGKKIIENLKVPFFH